MKIDVLQHALEDTKLYITSLNMTKSFHRVIQQYEAYCEKGLFMRFGIYQNYYSHYTRRLVGTPRVPPIPDIRERWEQMEKKRDSYHESIEEIVRKKRQWEKVEKKQREYAYALEHELPRPSVSKDESMAFEKRGDRVVEFYNDRNPSALLVELIELEQEELKWQEEMFNSYLKLLSKSRASIRCAQTALENRERFYVHDVFRFFIHRLQHYLQDMFKDGLVYIKPNKEKVWEYYTEQELKYDDDERDDDERLTRFENKMCFFVEAYIHECSVYVKTKENEYCIGKKSIQASVPPWKQRTERFEDELDEAQINYEEFQRQHVDFMLVAKAITSIDEQFKEPSFSRNLLVHYLKNVFATEVLETHDKLVAKIKDVRRRKDEFEPVRSKVRSFEEEFPYIKIATEKKQNMAYKIALREDKYDDVMVSLSTDTHFWRLSPPATPTMEG